MLAATSIGAIWSSCSPDFGVNGVLDRFGQIQPRVLFCCRRLSLRGQDDRLPGDRAREIADRIPEHRTRRRRAVPDDEPDVSADSRQRGLASIVRRTDATELDVRAAAVRSSRVHPLFVRHDRRAEVHRAQRRRHAAAASEGTRAARGLRRDDRYFYFTTCGWVMWNGLVSALAVGATIVLFDGAPLHPDPRDPVAPGRGRTRRRYSARARAFSTACEQAGMRPREEFDLSSLRAIVSTGAPLQPQSYRLRVSRREARRAARIDHRRHRHHGVLRRRLSDPARVRRRDSVPRPGHEDRGLRRQRRAADRSTR